MKHLGWRAPTRSILLFAALWLLTRAAEAQVFDTVEVTREGDNAVVRVRFAVLIQYLRHVPVDRGSTIQIYFQITAADEPVGIVEEERRGPKTDLVPNFRVVFPSQGAAGAQRRFDILFDAPVTFQLRPLDNRTIALIVPLSGEQIERLRPPRQSISLPPSAVPEVPATEPDRAAAAEFTEGRRALAEGDFERATLALNRVLNMPPNAYSQEAQELIGIAREKDGDARRARAEYELYLRLYPDTEGAARVKQRLAELVATPPQARAPRRPPQTMVWGSLSQYYYGGQSSSVTETTIVTPATNATTIDVARLSGVDQRQLVNAVDLNGRYRDNDWDARAVLREQYTANFMHDQDDRQRLNALYAEARYGPQQLFARVGRQTGTSGGVLGRFDGMLGSWGFRPNWRVNAVVGQPVEIGATWRKTFYGASLDVENVLGAWSANAFAIRQVTSGQEDRTGVGGELRYFDPQRSAYSLFDYDPTFRAVNVAMAQGTWQLPSKTTFNFLADYRRTPTLQLTNALLSDPSTSLGTLIATRGIGATREQAKQLTPISRVFLLGVTQELTPRWQAGFDARLSSLSSLPAVGGLPATPGTGDVTTYTGQLIGNGLTSMQDILVLNASVLRGRLNNALQAGIDYRFVPLADLVVEPMFKWYRQTDPQGVRLVRLTPALKLVYRVRERFALEAEFDAERSRTTGPLVFETVTRRFWYIGWRWDF